MRPSLALLFAKALGQQERWSVIVDCGSTGSRLYAYHVGRSGSTYSGGVGVSKGKKVRPGLASFQRNVTGAVQQMAALLREGQRLVPLEFVNTTRAVLRCTGGVRDELDSQEQQQFLDALFAGLRRESPFRLERHDIAVVDGDDEAFYAFAAANFLERRIDHRLEQQKGSLFGALDLGGSSTQITYPVLLRDEGAVEKEHLVARSYAGVGAQAVRERVLEDLRRRNLPGDPCSHVGYLVDGELPGLGDFEACLAAIRVVVLGAEKAAKCYAETLDEDDAIDDPDDDNDEASRKRRACAISSMPMEPHPTTHFLAMCNYFYAADAIRALAPPDAPKLIDWPTPPLENLAAAVDHFCARPWTDVNRTSMGRHLYTPPHLLPSRCFDAALILVLLRDVYALDDYPRVTFALDARESAVEVEWTLGYFLSVDVPPPQEINDVSTLGDDFDDDTNASHGPTTTHSDVVNRVHIVHDHALPSLVATSIL